MKKSQRASLERYCLSWSLMGTQQICVEEKGRRNKGKVQREEKEEGGMLSGLYQRSFDKSINPCGVLSKD